MDVNFKQLPPPMALALSASFGSPALWHEDFTWRAASEPLALCFDARRGRLLHRPLAPAGNDAVLLRSDEPLDWPRVYERYQRAVHDASEGAGVQAESLGDAMLLDVRRAGVFERAATTLPGRPGTTRRGWPTGRTSCSSRRTWSSTVSTATRSGAPPRCACVRTACARATSSA